MSEGVSMQPKMLLAFTSSSQQFMN